MSFPVQLLNSVNDLICLRKSDALAEQSSQLPQNVLTVITQQNIIAFLYPVILTGFPLN